jgi:hypothetical protein
VVRVQVLNNAVETFQSMPVSFEIESLDGNFKRHISAKTCPSTISTGYKAFQCDMFKLMASSCEFELPFGNK